MKEVSNEFHHVIQRRCGPAEPWFDCGPKYFGEDGIPGAILAAKIEAKMRGSEKVQVVRRDTLVTEIVVSLTDVHTEHCCIRHGCEYGPDDECSVVSATKPQSFRCEQCEFDLNEEGGLDLAYAINGIYNLGFNKGNLCKVCKGDIHGYCYRCA